MHGVNPYLEKALTFCTKKRVGKKNKKKNILQQNNIRWYKYVPKYIVYTDLSDLCINLHEKILFFSNFLLKNTIKI